MYTCMGVWIFLVGVHISMKGSVCVLFMNVWALL